jgi:D-ribose pyranose/furanose isomerase RbsD
LLRKNSQIILDKWPGFRPLHAAIFFGHTQVVKLFLEDKRIEIPENPNLIDLALAMNRVEIVDILEKLKKKQGEEKDKSAESELNNGMRRYRQ